MIYRAGNHVKYCLSDRMRCGSHSRRSWSAGRERNISRVGLRTLMLMAGAGAGAGSSSVYAQTCAALLGRLVEACAFTSSIQLDPTHQNNKRQSRGLRAAAQQCHKQYMERRHGWHNWALRASPRIKAHMRHFSIGVIVEANEPVLGAMGSRTMQDASSSVIAA